MATTFWNTRNSSGRNLLKAQGRDLTDCGWRLTGYHDYDEFGLVWENYGLDLKRLIV